MSAAKTNATVEKNKTKKPVDDVALPADDVIEDEKDESLEDEDLLEGIPEEELKAVESSAVAAQGELHPRSCTRSPSFHRCLGYHAHGRPGAYVP